MKHRWSRVQNVILLIALYALGSPLSLVYAERGGTANQDQGMKQMMEMLKQSGMDPKQMQQMENMMKGMTPKQGKRPSATSKKAQQKFKAETAGHGTAHVEVEGKRYELTMTKCELWGSHSRQFNIAAQQAPGMDDGQLTMGAGKKSRVGLSFESAHGFYLREGVGPADKSSSLMITDNTLQWEGQVGESENIPATIHVTCGAEMVNYSKPATSRPKTSPNVLTLFLGEEAHQFQTGYCSMKEYRTGNLMVEFGLSATGTFRGRPAIIFLSKSHPVGDQPGHFERMEMRLGELSEAQRTISPGKASRELDDKVSAYLGQENMVLQKIYKEEMNTIQKKYGKDVPQDKMLEVTEAYTKAGDTYSKKQDKVREQGKAMQYPETRSYGTITVTGQKVHYRGPKFQTVYGKQVPEFQNLSAEPELWVTCGL